MKVGENKIRRHVDQLLSYEGPMSQPSTSDDRLPLAMANSGRDAVVHSGEGLTSLIRAPCSRAVSSNYGGGRRSRESSGGRDPNSGRDSNSGRDPNSGRGGTCSTTHCISTGLSFCDTPQDVSSEESKPPRLVWTF